MMTPKSLVMCAFGFFSGMAAYAIFQGDGYSPGTIGILTMLWLSQMAALILSLIFVLLCEVRIEQKPLKT